MLSDDELEYFEALLKERERETLRMLESGADSAKPVSMDQAIGRLTRIDAIQQQQIALHSRGRLEQQLARIRAALRRVSDGNFGECIKCDEPIGRRRLEVAPENPVCMHCLQKME